MNITADPSAIFYSMKGCKNGRNTPLGRQSQQPRLREPSPTSRSQEFPNARPGKKRTRRTNETGYSTFSNECLSVPCIPACHCIRRADALIRIKIKPSTNKGNACINILGRNKMMRPMEICTNFRENSAESFHNLRKPST